MTPGTLFSDFVDFREEFKETMRHNHAAVFRQYVDNRADISNLENFATGLSDEDEEERFDSAGEPRRTHNRRGVDAKRSGQRNEEVVAKQRAMLDRANSQVLSDPARAATISGELVCAEDVARDPTDANILKFIDSTTTGLARVRNRQTEYLSARQKAYKSVSPEDHEWNEQSEMNCALMYFHFIRGRIGLARKTEKCRNTVRARLAREHPFVDGLLKHIIESALMSDFEKEIELVSEKETVALESSTRPEGEDDDEDENIEAEIDKHNDHEKFKNVVGLMASKMKTKEPLATEKDFEEFLSTIAGMESQSDINATIGILLEAMQRSLKTGILSKCITAWKQFSNEKHRVTIKTAGSYASQDAPTAYNRWHTNWLTVPLYAAVDPTVREHYIGVMASRLFWQKYICTPKGLAGETAWYKLDQNSHYIRPIAGAAEVTNDIAESMIPTITANHDTFKYLLEHITRKFNTANANNRIDDGVMVHGESMKEILAEFVKAFTAIKKMVFAGGGGMKLMNAMKGSKLLNCSNFGEVENSNPSFIAFENGVIDLGEGGGSISFRPGKVEDYVTKSTKIAMPRGGKIGSVFGIGGTRDLTDVFSKNHFSVKYLDKYLSEVFPDDELLEFMLRDLSSLYYGRNSEKLCRIWTGGGNNSKSIIIKILQKVFGDYAFDLPPESLAVNPFKDGSAPSPELAQGEGARVGIAPEPSGTLKLDAALIKRITGGDRIFTRKLHDNGSSKEQQYKIIIPCNEEPDQSALDPATKNRFVDIPYLSTWTSEVKNWSYADQVKARKFAIDTTFEVNVPRLAKALAWKLFHSYDDYRRVGLSERPAIVKKHTSDYWKRVDTYLGYIDQFVDKTGGDGIPASELYTHFAGWYSKTNPGARPPPFKEFIINATRADCMGPFVAEGGRKSGWSGCNIIPDEVADPPPPSPSPSARSLNAEIVVVPEVEDDVLIGMMVS